jgi:hypothetical protein
MPRKRSPRPQFCKYGHDTHIAGRIKNGRCKACAQEDYKKLQDKLNNDPFMQLKYHFSQYGLRSKRRQTLFALSFEEFSDIVLAPCYYCGAPAGSTSRRRTITTDTVISGIDRIDNNGGYTADNVVPCCRICNVAKSTLTQEEFYDWLRKITKRLDIIDVY